MAQHSPTASYETTDVPELGKLRLRELREAQGISQSELARRLSLPQKTYNQYETGAHKVPLNILVRLAEYHAVTLDYLVGYSDINLKAIAI
ncbi:hypothetical protein FACS1894184_11560 [Clostridia bacterium]|nr:hypothetical protein FACS1894184_11560 [Clostridia bacterium]